MAGILTVQPISAIRCPAGRQSEVRIRINTGHLDGLLFPIFHVILDNTQRVDPEETLAESAGEVDGVLESPWKKIPFNLTLMAVYA